MTKARLRKILKRFGYKCAMVEYDAIENQIEQLVAEVEPKITTLYEKKGKKK